MSEWYEVSVQRSVKYLVEVDADRGIAEAERKVQIELGGIGKIQNVFRVPKNQFREAQQRSDRLMPLSTQEQP
jgi:hypothetical protein